MEISKLHREHSENKIVLITGVTSSGKSMLAPVVSSLKNSEKIMFNFVLEQYPILHYLGKISDDTAKYLIRYTIDLMLYDNMIGRDVNFRFSDETSVWKTSNPRLYFERLFMNEGVEVFKRMKEKKSISVFSTHNSVWHSKVYFKAFPSIKMIHCKRNPVDIIYRWHEKGFGSKFYYGPQNRLLTFKWKNKVLPYYAYGWEEEFLNLSEIDSIINMVYNISKQHEKSYKSLSNTNKEKILIVSFEEIVVNPRTYLEKICSFLNTKVSDYTSIVLKNENIPRENKNNRQETLDKIKKMASKKYYDLLISMNESYSNGTLLL